MSSDLPLLEKWLAAGPPRKHQKRIEGQRAAAMAYLIAWAGKRPVGHVLIRWGGSKTKYIAARVRKCPDLEDLRIDPDFRRQGIGSALMRAAERLVRGRGFKRVGLSVGVRNETARAL